MTEVRTTGTRLKSLEDYAVRHGELIQGLLEDVEKVKAVQRAQELKDVREEASWAAVLKELKAFDERLGRVEGIGNKALGVFIIAIIGAFATFVIRGGLA